MYFIQQDQSIFLKSFFIIIFAFCFTTITFAQDFDPLELKMSYDDAVSIAIETSRKASGVLRKIEKKEIAVPTKPKKNSSTNDNNSAETATLEDEKILRKLSREIKISDKLDLLGVSDSKRLFALKLYIIRNKQIGVQSVWRYDKYRNIFQKYTIPQSAFDDLSSSKTIAELAKIIKDKSKIQTLNRADAESVVLNCRKTVFGNVNINEIEKTKQITSEFKKDGIKYKNFYSCLEGGVVENVSRPEICGTKDIKYRKNKIFGIKCQKFRQADGKIVRFRLVSAELIELKKKDPTYNNLIEHVRKRAFMPVSLDEVATRIFFRSLIETILVKKDKDEILPSQIDEYLAAKLDFKYKLDGKEKNILSSFRLDTILDKNLVEENCKRNSKVKLECLKKVSAANLSQRISKNTSQSALYNYYHRKNSDDNYLVKMIKPEHLKLKDDMKLKEVVSRLKKTIKKQVKRK